MGTTRCQADPVAWLNDTFPAWQAFAAADQWFAYRTLSLTPEQRAAGCRSAVQDGSAHGLHDKLAADALRELAGYLPASIGRTFGQDERGPFACITREGRASTDVTVGGGQFCVVFEMGRAPEPFAAIGDPDYAAGAMLRLLAVAAPCPE